MAKTARILIVDDDPDFVEINKTILESHGYTVETADRPANAWEKVKNWMPDLICLDVMMPSGTEGFHFAYKVRSDTETRDIPILMITSIHDHSDFQFSPDQDGDFLPVEYFLEKPIKSDVLISHVELLLESGRAKKETKPDKGIGLKRD